MILLFLQIFNTVGELAFMTFMDPNMMNVLEQGGYLPNYSVIIVVWQMCGLLGYLSYSKLFNTSSKSQAIWDYPSDFSATNIFIDSSGKIWPNLQSYLEKTIMNPNNATVEIISASKPLNSSWIEILTFILTLMKVTLIFLTIFIFSMWLITTIYVAKNSTDVNLTSLSSSMSTFLLNMETRTSLLMVGGLLSPNLLIYYLFNFSIHLILIHMIVTLSALIIFFVLFQLYSYYEKWEK